MKLLLKQMFVAAAIGFIIPTFAFAVTDEPPAAAAPSPAVTGQQYLFQLSYEDAEGAIGFALAERGAGNKISATIAGHKNDALFSYDKPISVEIRGLEFDTAATRWNASLYFISGEDVISAVPVAGRYEEIVEVPVLKRQVKSSEVISAKDIEIRDFPFNRVRSDTVTDMASLIGKSPERTISAARPIRDHEIARPAIVKKNSIVQMQYNTPGMSITASGQAMGEGARGNVIEVKNLSSKKLIRAVIVDESTVNIIGPGTLTSQNSRDGAYAKN